jgi:hypothetical protein
VSSAPAPAPSGTADAGEQPSRPTSSGPGEACPLCGAPLHAEQEWCLNCGAAARTRLAASPAWKAPIVSILVVLVLALGVLAGSLVKLAGGSTPAATQTTTVTAPATTQSQLPSTTTPPTTPTTTTTTTGPDSTTPGSATTPGARPKRLPSLRELEARGIARGAPGVRKAVEERLRKLRQLPQTSK